ncbi:hypothetical protein HID58_025764 [Brassica napus]|uniref:Uncharacterized protein n=1 Tax=Brassica napus TaxID=3708 RepID=A0ABQ8CM22_BRANA|nr:hypothetical protein HID58_025764 [Brassica napus]
MWDLKPAPVCKQSELWLSMPKLAHPEQRYLTRFSLFSRFVSLFTFSATILWIVSGEVKCMEFLVDVTNVPVLHLYNHFGGKKTKLPEMYVVSNLLHRWLKFFADCLLEGNLTEGASNHDKNNRDKSRPLLSKFVDISKQSCYVSIPLVSFVIYKDVTKEM